MAELRESSVLFSLTQLMDLEKQRLEEEQAAERRRAEAETAARADGERRAREQEEAERRAEEEQSRAAQARRREEDARIEAIRMAELERARIEAEQRARIEAMEKQQQHERQLAAIELDVHAGRLRRSLVVTAVAAAVLLGAGLAAYFGKIKPEADAVAERQRALLAAREEEMRRLEADVARHAAMVERARGDLALAQDEATRARRARELADAEKAAEAARKKAAAPPAAPSPIKKPGPCPCDRLDPMCACWPP